MRITRSPEADRSRAPPDSDMAPLDAILCTDELERRPSRPPDYETENRALGKLIQALAESPGTILQVLADTLLEVFKADSAGLSLLTEDGTRFYWPAIAGKWKPHLGGGTPRDFGPCGDVLDRNAPLMFKHWERRYPYLAEAVPLAEEGLLVPFYVGGKAVGTIWALTHGDRRRFDAEDLRQLESLSRFASAAFQATELQGAEEARRRLEELNERLRASDARARELLQALPVAVYTTDAEGRITFFNQAAVEMAGRTPTLGTDEWCVTWKLYRPDGTPLPHDQCPMAVALKEKRPVRGEEAIAERPDGTRVPFIPYPTPLFDVQGRLTGAINMLVNIAERRRAEGYAERLAAIVESSDDAIVSKNLNGIIQSWNKGAERLFGYTAKEAIGQPIYIVIPPDRKEEEAEILARLRRGERIDHKETVRRRKDGSPVNVSLSISPLKDAAGRVFGASKIARDITRRKRAEERQQLLINELNHRVKNTLATVQSLAVQSFRSDRGEGQRQFEGRLMALARAHDVLTRENWESADLAELVATVIAPICLDGPNGRFEVNGVPLRLDPRLALSLTMVLHELCTNALKYGALKSGIGRVRLMWSASGAADARRLTLMWEESGGPTVEAPPRKGFGTRLIEQALSRDFDAEVSLAFPPSGLVCEMRIPLTVGSMSAFSEEQIRREDHAG